MAGVWMTGSSVLRAPAAAAGLLAAWQGWLLAGPGGWITAPLRVLDAAAGGAGGVAGALTVLVSGAAASLLLAAQVARAAAARGWEQAGPLWVEAASGRRTRGRARTWPPVSLAGKDGRQLLRDRTRLVTLLALPTLFIGAQVFGSAGWGFSTASPTRLAICAYSLAAYAATFGPLVHLEAERRAFWILRAVPVPVARLFAHKASFWSLILGGYAAVMYAGLGQVAGFRWDGDFLQQGAEAVLGAVLVAWLAVGLGAAEADLSDDQRSALGLGTAYLFMIVSGLFNLAIIATAADRLRALALFVIAAVIAFTTGVERARAIFDPDLLAGKRLSPVVGALGMILLFLGARAVRLVGTGVGGEARVVAESAWLIIVAAFASWHWLRNRGAAGERPRAQVVALTLLTVTAALSAVLALGPIHLRGPAVGVIQVIVEEILARGIVQAGLVASCAAAASPAGLRPKWWSQVPGLLASTALVATVVPAPGSWTGSLAAVVPALAWAVTGRLGPALGLRLLIEAPALWAAL
jgi:hypothetical protein